MPILKIYVAPSQKRTTHAKVFVFDGHIAVVGCTTWTPLSEEINSEVVAAINDKPFAQQTRLRIFKLISGNIIEYKIKLDERERYRMGPEDTSAKSYQKDELCEKSPAAAPADLTRLTDSAIYKPRLSIISRFVLLKRFYRERVMLPRAYFALFNQVHERLSIVCIPPVCWSA